MAITFPRAIPDLPIAGISFDLEPMIEITPLRSGKQISADLGPTLWRGKWQSSQLGDDEIATVKAWYATLLSAESFYGWDKLREYPRAYADGWGSLTVGGSPFDGTCTLVDVAAGLVEIDLADLPVGFVLSIGDYLAFDYSIDSRALHVVVAGGTADGSGNLTIEVRPPVRVGWEADAVVQLHRPAARMIIIPGTWSCPVEAPFFGRASFEAIQTL